MSWRKVAKSFQVLAAHVLLFSFTLLLVLKLDHLVSCSWWFVFFFLLQKVMIFNLFKFLCCCGYGSFACYDSIFYLSFLWGWSFAVLLFLICLWFAAVVFGSLHHFPKVKWNWVDGEVRNFVLWACLWKLVQWWIWFKLLFECWIGLVGKFVLFVYLTVRIAKMP